jgi:hypothetical protein
MFTLLSQKEPPKPMPARLHPDIQTRHQHIDGIQWVLLWTPSMLEPKKLDLLSYRLLRAIDGQKDIWDLYVWACQTLKWKTTIESVYHLVQHWVDLGICLMPTQDYIESFGAPPEQQLETGSKNAIKQVYLLQEQPEKAEKSAPETPIELADEEHILMQQTLLFLQHSPETSETPEHILSSAETQFDELDLNSTVETTSSHRWLTWAFWLVLSLFIAALGYEVWYQSSKPTAITKRT